MFVSLPSTDRVRALHWVTILARATSNPCLLVYNIWQGKRLRVRLIAVVFPDEQAQALRQQKQAREKGHKLSEQSLFLAGFHLLVTTLPEQDWPVSLVLELYRCRWQIEILSSASTRCSTQLASNLFHIIVDRFTYDLAFMPHDHSDSANREGAARGG